MTETALTVAAERPKPQIVTGAAVAGLVPQSLEEAYRLAQWCASSGLTPKGIDTPEKCLYVIMAGADLKMPPAQALQSFALISGKLTMWGDAIPALLWSNGFKLREWTDGSDDSYPDTMIARCEITRPDGEVILGEFSVADAKEGKLWGKEGPWQTSKKRMLKMRARAFCARDGAADLLRGLYVAEEVQDYGPIPGETHGERTGMVERLKARAAPEVDAAGFNVRQITADTDAAKPKGRGKARGTAPEPDAAQGGIIDAVIEERPQGDAAASADAILDGDDLPGDLARPTSAQPAESQETAQEAQAEAATPASEHGTEAEAGSPATGDDTLDDDEMTSAFIDPDTGKSYPTMEARLEAARAEKAEPEPEPDAEFAACTAFINAASNVATWAEIKKALAALKKLDGWTNAPPLVQRAVHGAAWRSPARERDKVDASQDPTGFLCWLGTGPDADAIDATLAGLWKNGGRAKLNDTQQKKLEEAARQAKNGVASGPAKSNVVDLRKAPETDALDIFTKRVEGCRAWGEEAEVVETFLASDAYKTADPKHRTDALAVAFAHAQELEDRGANDLDPTMFRLWVGSGTAGAPEIRPVFRRLIRADLYQPYDFKDALADEMRAVTGD
jgi:hypothetical protein